jgi:transposase
MEQKNNVELNVIPLRGTKRFSKRIIKEVVLSIEEGMARIEAIATYGMGATSLNNWMRRYGSQNYHQNKRVTVGAHKKRSVVMSILDGRMTISEAQLAYNMKSDSSIRKWIINYKRENDELVAPNPPAELKKNKKDKPLSDLEQKYKLLQEALEYEQLKTRALNTMIDIAEEQLKISIRKKSGARQS